MLLHGVTFEPLRDEAGEQGWIETLSLESEEAQAHRLWRDDEERKLGRYFNAAEEWKVAGELFAKLTKDWHLVGLDGRALAIPCTYDAAVQLYTHTATRWLRQQVQNHIQTRSNFFPLAGSMPSASGHGISGGSTSPSSEAAPDAPSTSEPRLPLDDEA
jgi:hypothetical protein